MVSKLVLAAALLLMAPLTSAEARGFSAKLAAEVSGTDVKMAVLLTNRTGENLCYFLGSTAEAMFRTSDGKEIQNNTNGGVIVGPPGSVSVLWKDDRQEHEDTLFGGLGPVFGSEAEAAEVNTVSYRLDVYDCVVLFSRGLDHAPMIFSKILSTKPTFLTPPK